MTWIRGQRVKQCMGKMDEKSRKVNIMVTTVVMY